MYLCALRRNSLVFALENTFDAKLKLGDELQSLYCLLIRFPGLYWCFKPLIYRHLKLDSDRRAFLATEAIELLSHHLVLIAT